MHAVDGYITFPGKGNFCGKGTVEISGGYHAKTFVGVGVVDKLPKLPGLNQWSTPVMNWSINVVPEIDIIVFNLIITTPHCKGQQSEVLSAVPLGPNPDPPRT